MKTLIFDIETSPNLAHVWGKWQQDVIAYETEWKLLCYAWKWLGEKEVFTAGQDQFDEETLVLRLHQLFDEADVIVAHNGNSFDIKKSNAKFIEYGLTPPSSYKSIDTKLVAKRYFMFNSNKLEDLGNILGVGHKMQTGGFALWLGCMSGDKKAWAKMLKYNIQDVVLLEKIYLKLRPWMENHPSVALYDGRPEACPKCGHKHLQSRGYRYTKVAKYQRFQCTSPKCGGWSQARKAEKTEVNFVN